MLLFGDIIMNQIFISHSSKDENIIKKICEKLSINNFTYWVSFENEMFGQSYASAIVDAINKCTVFLVFMSENSNKSSHIVNEINSAVMRDKMIIPIKLDNVSLSGVMEYYLSSNHWIVYSQNNIDIFINKLTHRLMSILHPEIQSTENTSLVKNDLVLRAEEGHVESQYQLAVAYHKGINGLPQDQKESCKWYMTAAQKEHANSQCNLAWCYEIGDGVEQDFEKAFYWYEKSAKNGCSMAQYSLGWMYENGIFAGKNQAKAFEWYNRAAEIGHPIAQYKVGLVYAEGSLVEQSDVLANHWFTAASDNNNVMAQYRLAENYYLGKGCQKDIIKAKNIWLLSAEQGYIKSYDALEKYYDIFYNGSKKTFDVD